MKIYAFEIVAGRKVDILPECQSLIEELLASHSTDLQQRAYELQTVIDLDANALKSIMPADASCEEIEIDKNLPFLDGYVQEAIEKGAQPYLPENERLGMSNIGNFRNQDHQDVSTHGLRFEAYELPTPSVPSTIPPVLIASTAELVPVPEPSYFRDSQKAPSTASVSSTDPSALKLRLDGVQKKWGKPTYSSSETSTSNSTSQKAVNGFTKVDAIEPVNSKARDTSSYDLRKPQVEISPEKQKLAASLFGGSSKTEQRPSTGHKTGKTMEKPQASKAAAKTLGEKAMVQPLPDLLDLGEPTVVSIAPTVDPFKQLEGLIDSPQVSSDENNIASGGPDIMGLYDRTVESGLNSGMADSLPADSDDADILSGLTILTSGDAREGTMSTQQGTMSTQQSQISKGPNVKEALQKDARVRQVGVNPSTQNPNLFKDLLG